MDVLKLIEQKEAEGAKAVALHSKSPADFPIVDDRDYLLRCERQGGQAAVKAFQLQRMKESDDGFSELVKSVGDHHYARGILRTLREIGGIRESLTPYSVSLAAYNMASELQARGDFEEARSVFETLFDNAEQEFRDGAAFHVACIEEAAGNTARSRHWYELCLRWNPGHKKARTALELPEIFHEVRPNTFERLGFSGIPKILFVVFGALGDVINAFPVVAGLRRKYPSSEIAWLTLPTFGTLVRRSAAHRVEIYEPRGVIPWDWAAAEGYTHVFYPEGNANHAESQQSGMHMIDFMAAKCDVALWSHRTSLQPSTEAITEAEKFMKRHGLRRGKFIAASHMGISSRFWPHARMEQVFRRADVPAVLFGGSKDPAIPGAIQCFGQCFEAVTAIIQQSAYYLGPDSGVSWLATTTETPMGVFIDPLRKRNFNVGFKDVLSLDKANIDEWTIYEEPEVVLERIHAEVRTPIYITPDSGHAVHAPGY